MKQQVVVIGLGRFGSAVARELQLLGHEVLGIDSSEATVNDIAPDITHAVQLDASDEDALRAAGAGDFGSAVVAMSSNTESSIFSTMVLKKLGVSNVVAKAGSALHGAILERVGADRVVFPEREMGIQVARTLNAPNVIDYLDVGPAFGIERVRPPRRFIGQALRDLDLPGRFKLTPIAVRRGDTVVVNPHGSERIAEGDELILIGRDERLEQIRE